jgi:hypothetical protein
LKVKKISESRTGFHVENKKLCFIKFEREMRAAISQQLSADFEMASLYYTDEHKTLIQLQK